MIWKIRFVLCAAAIAGQAAMAQNSAGNPLTGEVKADVLKHYSGPGVLPKPDRIVIRNFAVPDGDITVDESIPARLHRGRLLRHGVDEDSSPEVLSRRVQAAFAKTLADELKKAVNIPTQNMPVAGGAMSGSELAVAGEFIAIHEGDEAKRIMVGFGRGASDIKTHVVVSSVTPGRTVTVLEFNLSSESGKKPGAVATMGVGSLAAGAAAGGVGDKKSEVEADASRMAKLVAKQLEAFMTEQKWISSAPVAVQAGQQK